MNRQLEQLTERAIMGLRKALDDANSDRLVILCDPLLADPLHEEIERVALSKRIVPPMRNRTKEQAPYLVDVRYDLRHERFVNDSLRLSIQEALVPAPWNRRPRSISAWLITDLSVHRIAADFIPRSNYWDAQRVLRTFRFWDPRTMQHAGTLTGKNPPLGFFPEIDWGFIDSWGHWQFVASPQDAGRFRPDEETLIRIGMKTAVLQRLTEKHPIGEERIWAYIDQALSAGLRIGLSDRDDLIHFAADRLRLKAPIEGAVRLKETFELLRQGQGSYSRFVADYEDEDWHRICESIPEHPEERRP